MVSGIYIPESAMAVMAHPDDIEFSCAGTLFRWRKAGARIRYVLATSGDAGINVPVLSRAETAAIREVESMAAAAVGGVDDVSFLHEPDGMVQATMELRKKIVREIRDFRPEVIICGDPAILWTSRDYINHPDHRATALAAVDAIFPAAGQRQMFEELELEGLKPFKPRKVYVSGWDHVDTFISIDETIDLKVAALREHKSQMKDWDPDPHVRETASKRAAGKEMTYAEAFRVITLRSDEEWEKRDQPERADSRR